MNQEFPSLTPEERVRYVRQLAIPEIGEEGQRRLKAARVLVVGLGGLGSPAALYLAAAGVGTLGIVDADTVAASNLQRQILYTERDVGTSKVEVASARLSGLNSHVTVRTYGRRFLGSDATDIARDYDVIVDGTDNLESRYLMNDIALTLGIAYVYGAVYQLEGQAALLCVPGAPCYRCLFPTPPPSAAPRSSSESGILGVVPGVIGLVEATEAVRWITGYAAREAPRLLLYDARRIEFTSIAIEPDATCPACGGGRGNKKPTGTP